VGGGGRYDGLSESLGGPPLPGVGIAPGIDRIMLAREASVGSRPVKLYLVALGERARAESFRIVTSLRRAGIGADLDVMDRSMKGQMKDASRSGALWAAILGDEEMDAGEVTLKNLDSGEQERVPLTELETKVAP
jgi:histidyl-tRNA synthetase